MGRYFLSEIVKSSRMNLDSDGMDDVVSQAFPLDLEGNYKKVRGGSSFVYKQLDHFSKWEESCQIPHTVKKKNQMHRINHSKLWEFPIFPAYSL